MRRTCVFVFARSFRCNYARWRVKSLRRWEENNFSPPPRAPLPPSTGVRFLTEKIVLDIYLPRKKLSYR